ncbi:MAG TPA: hypothetical protein VIL37_08055 [Natronosporangium sp.]
MALLDALVPVRPKLVARLARGNTSNHALTPAAWRSASRPLIRPAVPPIAAGYRRRNALTIGSTNSGRITRICFVPGKTASCASGSDCFISTACSSRTKSASPMMISARPGYRLAVQARTTTPLPSSVTRVSSSSVT